MILLIMSELHTYLSPNITEELFVDTTRNQKLRINLDIIVPTISCNCEYTLLRLHISTYLILNIFNFIYMGLTMLRSD